MEIRLDLTNDSHNSYLSGDKLIIDILGDKVSFYIEGGDERVVHVDKDELTKVLKLL